MPKIAAQNAPPTTANSSSLPQEPRRSWRRRASAPRHFGVSRVQTAGWAGAAATSGSEHGVELRRARAARQLEEQVFEAHLGRLSLLPELVHRAAGGDPSLVDDRDPVAHHFGHF